MAANTVTKASEDVAGTSVQRYSDATDYNSQTLLKTIVKPLSDMTSEIKRAFAGLGVVTKTDNEAIVENPRSEWTNMQQLQMIKGI